MDFIKETLDWVNRERFHRGIGPALEDIPKGVRRNGTCCPLANALRADYVGGGIAIYHIEADDEVAKLPESARQFADAFDHGELPQYDEYLHVLPRS